MLKSFYPTPPSLVSKMVFKIKGHPTKVLEPSAGKGDLAEGVADRWKYSHGHKADISVIEINPDLQATLRGKGMRLIDTDFLAYSGADKWDLIIANPPFDEGDKHLAKALDIIYRGQVIFLLNAETLRNPFTNDRKALVRRLEEMGAEIEYISGAFLGAERKTGVEVALVSVVIDRKVEDDLFAGCDDHGARAHQTVADQHEVSTGLVLEELVREYDRVISVGTESIVAFYRNYRVVGKYLSLEDAGSSSSRGSYSSRSSDDLTAMMQGAINNLLKRVRTDFWRRTLDLKEVRSRLTKKKQDEFEHAIADRCNMDFTESNIRQFVINLIAGGEQTLIEAVLDIFEMFTVRHCWSDDNRHEKNIHYFNGWKTNSAFKVGKRVVVPIHGSYGGPFQSYGKWSLDYQAAAKLRDIDIVMASFNGAKDYVSIADALTSAFARDVSSGIESTFFRATCHKKGTIHLTFLDEDILRRFNVVACRGKGWLPGDFGSRPYRALSVPEQAVVDSFEGEASYDTNLNSQMFVGGSMLPQIPFLQAAVPDPPETPVPVPVSGQAFLF